MPNEARDWRCRGDVNWTLDVPQLGTKDRNAITGIIARTEKTNGIQYWLQCWWLKLKRKVKVSHLTCIWNLQVNPSAGLNGDFTWNSVQINDRRTLTCNRQRSLLTINLHRWSQYTFHVSQKQPSQSIKIWPQWVYYFVTDSQVILHFYFFIFRKKRKLSVLLYACYHCKKMTIIFNKIILKGLLKQMAINRLMDSVTAWQALTAVPIFCTTEGYDSWQTKARKRHILFFHVAYLRRPAVWLKFHGRRSCRQSQLRRQAWGLWWSASVCHPLLWSQT